MMIRVSLLISAALIWLPTAHGQINRPYGPEAGAAGADASHPQQQSLFRHATFPQAWAAAQSNQRPVLLYVTSDNCLYCKKMLRQTLAHPQISQVIAEHMESFAFNATQSPELAQKLGVRGYPTTLVISPERELLCQINGFVEPQEFAKRVWPALQQAEAARQLVQGAASGQEEAVFRN